MRHDQQSQAQFSPQAQAYLHSAVHAQGGDLARLAARVRPGQQVLDLGCGAGHVAFHCAQAGAVVTACDPAPGMLEVVAREAVGRGLAVRTVQALAERLPFEDGQFDQVFTRFSAHHWHSVPLALREVARVLKPGGSLVVVDVVASESPLADTALQTLEMLRDPSHVRDYRVSEWLAMLADAGLRAEALQEGDIWSLTMQFDVWTARMKTSAVRVAALREVLAQLPEEVKQELAVQPEGHFNLAVAWLAARR